MFGVSVVESTHSDTSSRFGMAFVLDRFISGLSDAILSVISDMFVNSKAPVVTSSTSRSFRDAHRDRVCALIGVSVRAGFCVLKKSTIYLTIFFVILYIVAIPFCFDKKTHVPFFCLSSMLIEHQHHEKTPNIKRKIQGLIA
jgi:hypothetical protein